MRRFVLMAAFVTLIGCERPHPPNFGVKIDPALAMLVPSDTVLMVGTRVEELVKTPVYLKYVAGRSIPQIDEFARYTKLDPRKELWELLFVSNGKQGVLLGRGKFSDQLEDPRAQKGNPNVSDYKGLTLVGDGKTAVMFINTSTAAVGSPDALRALADQREHSGGPPAPLVALMKDLPKEAQFWAVYLGGPVKLPFDDNSNLGNINKLLSSVQTGSLYLDLRTGVKGVAQGNCSSDQAAQRVHDALKALIGFGRLSVKPGQEELLPVYDSIQVTQNTSQIKVQMDVPQNLVDQLLAVWLGTGKPAAGIH
jgi:hypothetical protein